MSRTQIRYIRAFLVTQINHWSLFPIVLLPFTLAKSLGSFDDPRPLLWLEVGVLAFLFLLFRMKIKQFWLLLLCHVLAAVLAGNLLFFQAPSSGSIYVIAVACYVIYSIVHRLRSEEAEDGRLGMPFAVGVSAVSLFLQNYQGYTQWNNWHIWILITVFAMYFASSYLERYLEFLTVNEGTTGHIPEKEIFSSGSRLMLIYVFFTVLVLFLTSSFGWLKTILNVLEEIFFAIMRFLLSGLKGNEEIVISKGPEASGGGDMFFMEPGETSLVWEILEVVAVIALVAAVLYGIIRLMLRLPAFIRERMGRRRTFKTDSMEGSVYDVRERCSVEKEKKTKGRRNPFSFLSNEERIRRLYKKHIVSAGRVQKFTENGTVTDLSLLTAREWGERLQEENLAAPYEKARYSDTGCSVEDLRAMKSVCR
ncbi:MAG: hypothetical protein NC417_10640 [Candidatus Gastranaerophilales bacterium]|nr:hypothetical protein [Candidatus Gastranaerophilales bacterium]